MKSANDFGSEIIAVYGATGHTGRFVVEELLKRGFIPIAVARDAAALAQAAYSSPNVIRRAGSVDDADSLQHAFNGARAVINCAGSFLDTADAVASAAVDLGIHYLDVTAEQPSAQSTLDRFDESARKAGVAVMPALGFFGGFADLLATVAVGEWTEVDEIDVMIGLDSWHPTLGTRLTGERNTATRLVVEEACLVPVGAKPKEMTWSFAEPLGEQLAFGVPFSEIVLISRHINTTRLHTYISANGLRDVRDTTTPSPVIEASGRSAQRFAVEVVAKSAGQVRRVIGQGQDIYAFSAPLVCEIAARLVGSGSDYAGAHAPGAIFNALDVLKSLQPDHLKLEIVSS